MNDNNINSNLTSNFNQSSNNVNMNAVNNFNQNNNNVNMNQANGFNQNNNVNMNQANNFNQNSNNTNMSQVNNFNQNNNIDTSAFINFNNSNYSNGYSNNYDNNYTKKKKNIFKNILLVLIFIIIVGLVVYGGYILLKNKDTAKYSNYENQLEGIGLDFAWLNSIDLPEGDLKTVGFNELKEEDLLDSASEIALNCDGYIILEGANGETKSTAYINCGNSYTSVGYNKNTFQDSNISLINN